MLTYTYIILLGLNIGWAETLQSYSKGTRHTVLPVFRSLLQKKYICESFSNLDIKYGTID